MIANIVQMRIQVMKVLTKKFDLQLLNFWNIQSKRWYRAMTKLISDLSICTEQARLSSMDSHLALKTSIWKIMIRRNLTLNLVPLIILELNKISFKDIEKFCL